MNIEGIYWILGLRTIWPRVVTWGLLQTTRSDLASLDGCGVEQWWPMTYLDVPLGGSTGSSFWTPWLRKFKFIQMGGGKFYYRKRQGYTDSILFIKHSKYYLSFFRIPDGISQVYSNFFPLITCRVGNGDRVRIWECCTDNYSLQISFPRLHHIST